MATPEQIAAMVQVAVETGASRLMEGLMPMIAANINTGGGGTTGHGGVGPSGKIFRDIGKFGGEEGAWAEWALKFRTTVKEYDAGLFQALELAGDSKVEIDMTEVAQSNIMDRCMEKSAILYNRFVHLLSGLALTLHQSVVGENGLEVWRLLKKRYDPKTTLRNLQLWLKIMNPGKVKKSQDFLAQVNRWEFWVNMLKRDYGQEVTETARVGLLILMAPDELQGTVLEHADRLREYRQIKEKMVMLLDASGQLKDPNAMDIGYSGEEDWTWETELGGFDMGAVGRSDHCYRCDGMGHIANECPTPKGKGKGKEDRSFYAKGMKGHEKGKGKSAGGKGHDKGKGKGSTVCAHCGKRGHDTSRCWTLHPEQLWKSTNVVEENYRIRFKKEGLSGIDVATKCIVIAKDYSSKSVMASVVPVKGASNEFPAKRINALIREIGLEGQDLVLRSDEEPALQDLLAEVGRRHISTKTFYEVSPVGSSASNGVAERGVQTVEGQIRVLKDAFETRVGAQIPSNHNILAWSVEFAGTVVNRYEVGRDGKTPFERLRGKQSRLIGLEFCEKVNFRRTAVGCQDG